MAIRALTTRLPIEHSTMPWSRIRLIPRGHQSPGLTGWPRRYVNADPARACDSLNRPIGIDGGLSNQCPLSAATVKHDLSNDRRPGYGTEVPTVLGVRAVVPQDVVFPRWNCLRGDERTRVLANCQGQPWLRYRSTVDENLASRRRRDILARQTDNPLDDGRHARLHCDWRRDEYDDVTSLGGGALIGALVYGHVTAGLDCRSHSGARDVVALYRPDAAGGTCLRVVGTTPGRC